jgi:hypothetical protein
MSPVDVVAVVVFFESPSLVNEKVCSLAIPSLPIEVTLFFFLVGSEFSGSLFGIYSSVALDCSF